MPSNELKCFTYLSCLEEAYIHNGFRLKISINQTVNLMYEIGNAEWNLREESDETFTLESKDGRVKIKGLTLKEITSLRAIASETSRAFTGR